MVTLRLVIRIAAGYLVRWAPFQAFVVVAALAAAFWPMAVLAGLAAAFGLGVAWLIGELIEEWCVGLPEEREA